MEKGLAELGGDMLTFDWHKGDKNVLPVKTRSKMINIESRMILAVGGEEGIVKEQTQCIV